MADQRRNEAMPRALGELKSNFELVLRDVGEPTAPTRRERMRRPQFVAVAATILIVAIAGLSAVLLSGSSTEQAIATLAKNAASQPAVKPTEFAFSDVELRSVVPSSTQPTRVITETSRYIERRRSWLSTERPGLVETTTIGIERVSGGQPVPEPDSINKVSITTPPVGRIRFLGELRTLPEIEAIAARPNGIALAVQKDLNDVHPDDRLLGEWDELSSPLKASSTPLPPWVRAKLVEALGEVPGVRSDDEATDPRGREAIAISLDAQGLTSTLMFGRETSELLSESVIARDTRAAQLRGVPVGTEINSYLLIESGVTDQLP